MLVLPYDEALKRAIACDAMLYNRKSNIKDDARDAELRFLYRLALLAPDGPAVECGVYHGGSLACWACARIGRGPIIAVDDWSSKCEEVFVANIARYPDLTVSTLSMPTHLAPAHIEGQVAFCFIDSSHAAGGIDVDIPAWEGKIMPGGVLAFHDYGTHKGVVKSAVDEWYKRTRWIGVSVVGSTIAFKRPE